MFPQELGLTCDFFRDSEHGAFDFIVGSRTFTVHRAPVPRASKPLSEIMRASTNETKTEKATLNDVDEAAFTRFVNWLYTGDFGLPRVGANDEEQSSQASDDEHDHIPEVDSLLQDSTDDAGQSRPSKRQKVKQKATVSQAVRPTDLWFFLAKLNAFADAYDIFYLDHDTTSDSISIFGCRRIKKLPGMTAEDLKELVECFFANTTPWPDEGARASMQSFVVQHAALNTERLRKTPVFQQLLRQHAEFAAMMVKNFASIGKDCTFLEAPKDAVGEYITWDAYTSSDASDNSEAEDDSDN